MYVIISLIQEKRVCPKIEDWIVQGKSKYKSFQLNISMAFCKEVVQSCFQENYLELAQQSEFFLLWKCGGAK